MPDKIRILTCPPITMPPPRAKKWARVFAKPRDARHMLSKPSDSDLEDLMEFEVDVSLMDEESQKIDYEKEDADEDWDDDYEEDDRMILMMRR